MEALSVLLIEGNPITRRLLRQTLERKGFLVQEARDGQSALSLLVQHPPSLILQDLLLPDIDSYDLVQQFRNTPEGSQIPIIACSRQGVQGEEEKLKSKGFDGALQKPIQLRALHETLQFHLAEFESNAQEADSQENLQKIASSTILIADDSPLQRHLLRVYLQLRGYVVLEAEDGKTALSLAREYRPDAVISDILMPQLDGFKLCQTLRQEPEFADTIILLVSNHFTEGEDRNLALQMGADDYLMRTPDNQALLDTLDMFLRVGRSSSQSPQKLSEYSTLQEPMQPLKYAVGTSTASSELPHRYPSGESWDALDSISQPYLPAVPPMESGHEVGRSMYEERIWKQVERQFSINQELVREVELLVSQLSFLASASRILARFATLQNLLVQMLSHYLDASRFSSGCIYIVQGDGSLVVKAAIPEDVDILSWQTLFGCPGILREIQKNPVLYAISTEGSCNEQETRLLERMGMGSVIISPLQSGRDLLGLMVLASPDKNSLRDGVFFAKAAGFQLGQAMMLARAFDKLTQSEQRFRSITETAHEGILVVDPADFISYANPAASRILGFEVDELIGSSFHQLCPLFRHDLGTREEEWFAYGQKTILLSVSVSCFDSKDKGTFYTYVFRDLREKRRVEAKLLRLSHRDSTTNLFNRRRFQSELETWLERLIERDEKGALLLLNLDHFNTINTGLGHHYGDFLLRSVAEYLRASVASMFALGRVGGDEFAMLLGCGEESEVLRQAQTIRRTLASKVFECNGQNIRLTASVGVVILPTHANEPEKANLYAEYALRYAKRGGRNRVCLYEPKLDRFYDGIGQLTWSELVRKALEEDRLVLHFQPILGIKSGKIEAYEALLRMHSPDGELIFPGQFLPKIEETSLMREIDRWVAFRAIKVLSSTEFRQSKLHLEINISAKTLNDQELLPMLQERLRASNIDPSRLILEITETAAIANLVEALQFVHPLREMGCRFALDDFGVGFTSFNQLKQLPVDILKIDGSFIRNLPCNEIDQHLVKAMINVAKGLGKQTVAEFVGDQETLDLLRNDGADYAQGFFIGKPGPELLTPSSSETP